MKDILAIEDSPEMRILVEAALREYQVTFCETLTEAKQALAKKKFDLLLLDLGLPDGDGLKFLTEISHSHQNMDAPVIILTAKSETANKVMAFSIGAEDFISKPFDPLELNARVTAKLKKIDKLQNRNDNLRVGDLIINIPKQTVQIQTSKKIEQVDLTTLEFKLLITLARSPERVFSREYLLTDVWGHDVNVTDRSVDTHVGHLRKKLIHSKTKIDTVIGAGYRMLLS